MTEITRLTIALLRHELCGGDGCPLPAETDDRTLQQIFLLASRHDLAHIVAAALRKTGLCADRPLAAQCKRQQILAVYRYEHIAYELTRMCAVLEDAGIPHMPLKGAHLRRYYPVPEMRTSSDIDLLVHPEDLERVVRLLCDTLGYETVRRGSHDELMHTPSGVQLELHFDLIEAERFSEIRQILSGAWETAVPLEGTRYGFAMSVEMLFFYHIAHMVKHFTEGGCGIRFFMDLWVLEHRAPAYDENLLGGMLEQCGLLPFAKAAGSLADAWFSDGEFDSLTADMADFVAGGGVYGSIDNRVQLKRLEKGGRLRYLLSRILIPYDSIKYQYPILQKHRWLLPFCEIHRWLRLLSRSTARRIRYELTVDKSVTPESQAATRDLLTRLGL